MLCIHTVPVNFWKTSYKEKELVLVSLKFNSSVMIFKQSLRFIQTIYIGLFDISVSVITIPTVLFCLYTYKIERGKIKESF